MLEVAQVRAAVMAAASPKKGIMNGASRGQTGGIDKMTGKTARFSSTVCAFWQRKQQNARTRASRNFCFFIASTIHLAAFFKTGADVRTFYL
ncbi:hypothetical protein [Thalassospira profundimaris]|uniref:hypothetical protein n=1 Tax=Thalassospira profundimaris TaxID=502049 RepID=UPI0015F0E90E|nr:hypothetical protein [Thalassospira profundimaris]